ncbi:AAA family ATPase [Flectobacillus roseus]
MTGENGFGKTSVLQALAVGFSPSLFLQESKVVFNHQLVPFENGVPLISNYPKEKAGEMPEKNILGYGSTRLISSENSKVLIDYTGLSSLATYSTLFRVEGLFKEWYKEYPEGKQKLEHIFQTLLPSIGKIAVEFNSSSKLLEVKYYEKDKEGDIYSDGVIFDQLAAGYKNILNMIGDMVFRLSQVQTDVNEYSDLMGVVLIDEIELHLHPKYQKLFVEKLTELFPKIQFIVSTHSPIPLLGAPANSVIINVTRTKEEGIQAKLLDIDFSVLTPNTILSSPIFGFQDLIPDSKSNEKMVRTEDTYKEVLFHDQLDKQIDEFLTDDRKQELLDLLKEK